MISGLALSLWLACRSEPAMVSEPAPVSLAEGVGGVRRGLAEARKALADGDRGAAARTVRETYLQRFDPLEDRLRTADAQTTFELEFAFGAVAHDIDDGADPAEVDARLEDLDGRVQALADRVAVAEVGAER